MKRLDFGELTEIITPPPIVPERVPVRSLDPIQATEYELDDHGHLMKSFWVLRQYTRGIIRAYDHWVTNVLPHQIMNRPIIVRRPDGDMVFRVTEVYTSPPMDERNGKKIPIYPKDAMDKKMTYQFTLSVKVERYNRDRHGVESRNPVERAAQQIIIGYIPAMVGSVVCNLRQQGKLDPMSLLRVRECPVNPLGYFITKGTERVLLMRDHLRTNRALLIMSPKSNIPVCRMTCNTPGGTKLVNVFQLNNHIRVSLSFMTRFRKDKKVTPNSMAVLPIFMVLGITDLDEMMNYILDWTSKERRNSFRVFMRTDIGIQKIANLEIVTAELTPVIQDPKFSLLNESGKESYIKELISEELFPHVEKVHIITKCRLLGMMVAKLIEYHLGLQGLDDRDSWEKKRIETGAKTMEQHFRRTWSSLPDTILRKISLQRNITIKEVFGEKMRSTITQSYLKAFNKNTWNGTDRKSGDVISDVMKYEASPISNISQMNRIISQNNSQDKKLGPRMVHHSQYGVIDPVETPEGKKCGLVRQLATTCMLSEEHNDGQFIDQVQDFDDWVRQASEPGRRTRFLLNGRFFGWCPGEAFREYLVRLRRRKVIFYDTCIVLERPGRDPNSVISDDDGGNLTIYTDSARPIRPLLIVNPDTQLTYIEEDFITKGLAVPNFQELMGGWEKTNDQGVTTEGGYVEYLDPYEIGNIYGKTTVLISESMQDLQKHRMLVDLHRRDRDQDWDQLAAAGLIEPRITSGDIEPRLEIPPPPEKLTEDQGMIYRRLVQTNDALNDRMEEWYTHCEIDMVAVLGIGSSLIPFLNFNQGVRNGYQCQMSKQAMGIPHSMYKYRFDSSLKVLAYPTRPLFESQMAEITGLSATPGGDTVTVAIMPLRGANVEDAVIFKKSAIDRGKFRYVHYPTLRITLESEARVEFTYIVEKPTQVGQGGGSALRIDNLDDRGIVMVGRRVKPGDILVARYRLVTREGQRVKEPAFLRLDQIEDSGVVHDVIYMKGKLAMVRIRSVKTPIEGNKFACFDDRTMILTWRRGWIFFSQLTMLDLVATLVDGEIIYSRPQEVHTYDFSGALLEIPGDIKSEMWRVTPNHRLYISTPGGCRFSRADELPDKFAFVRQGTRRGLIDVPSALVVILAAAVHRGRLLERPRIQLSRILLHLKADLFEAIQCPLTFITIDGKSDKGWTISVDCSILWDILDEAVANPDGSSTKPINPPACPGMVFPREFLLALPDHQARLFVSWYWLMTSRSDSYSPERAINTFGKFNGRAFTMHHAELADLFSQLIFHAGWSAQITKQTERDQEKFAVKFVLREPQVNVKRARPISYQGKVYCCTVPSGIIYVRRNGVPMWSGNSREAQKHVLSAIVNDEDMPWVGKDGTTPDVIINPQCIPSRMTIAMLIEMVMSKIGALRFERVNATGFRPFRLDEFLRTMKEYGFHPGGVEVLYSPRTGQPIGQVYIGLCYYQALKHLVEHKIQGRGIEGKVNTITRQPPGNRSRPGEGGLRAGVLEVAVMQSHGAAHTAQEILCKYSDEISMVVCSCGYVPTTQKTDVRHVRCVRCGKTGRYSVIKPPYVTPAIQNIMGGANINIAIHTNPR